MNNEDALDGSEGEDKQTCPECNYSGPKRVPDDADSPTEWGCPVCWEGGQGAWVVMELEILGNDDYRPGLEHPNPVHGADADEAGDDGMFICPECNAKTIRNDRGACAICGANIADLPASRATDPPDEGKAENPYDRTIREIKEDPYCGPADDQPGEGAAGDRCQLCGHLWRKHDPEDGECDAHATAEGHCPCGRDFKWMREQMAAFSVCRLTDRPAPDGREGDENE